ncbi:molybdate ABC transporter permease subunit [Argonema galeatum]|uniref:molybdate ABC transporter permease subunit n=1 Tax=Argonema galeatum TaxID=2942762 RepID=UPI002012531F|nr:molybdate ABC transporter permease subunit [Argonema galeatum]MCL1468842.1 molybdate ABC transporter permease subunit [Argonema galeatum A003/A1]
MTNDLSPLWISLKTAFIATIVTFFLGIAAAKWMLGYRGKGKGLIEGIFISPLVLPPTVVGFLLLLLLGKNGPIGQILLSLGITIIFSWPATVIAATVVAFPLMYKTALGAFEQIDSNLISAGRTLGASEWRVFWRVILPLALPGIVAGTMLSFARALGEFGATLMLAGNIPGQTQTIPVAIYFAVEAGDMNLALIWVFVILAISLSVLTAVNFWSGGLKTGNRRTITNHRSQITNHQSLITNSQLFINIEKQLSDFSLSVAFNLAGETLGVLGASGAGKSMMLRCIAGLSTPTRGQIVLNGRVLFDSTRGINLSSHQRRVGFLFQNYALFPHMTVAENIAFGLPKLSNLERNQRVREQLTLVQLQELENRYPRELSGGQQQRVALARALAIEPEILLLDEPFSALDTYLRSQLEKQLIETLSNYRGVTLFVTHNLEEAYRICQNLLVLSEGKVAAYGGKEEIFEHPRTFTVAQLTGCKNFSRADVPKLHFEKEGLREVEALDWGCTLRVIEPIPNPLAYVGIRAHHFTFPEDDNKENTFLCWVAQTSETPHRMTLYLKLHAPPVNAKDYHLQAEVFKEKWAVLKDRPLPWYIRLDPLRLFLMEG